MLQRLLNCKDMDGMIELGVTLLSNKAMMSLQEDIRKGHLVFSSDNYWSEDELSLYTVNELIDRTSTEEYDAKILHRLQLLQKCCPAIFVHIQKLLAKSTC